MANEANDKNFKKELTEKIRKSVRKSFEENIKGKGGTENPRIRDFERNVTDGFGDSARERGDRYEDIKKNTGSGFAGGVAGRGRAENPRTRNSRQSATGDSSKSPREEKDRYENIKKNAMGGFAGGATRQAETRRIKENIKKSRENLKKNVKEKGKKIKEKTKENLRKRKVALKGKLRKRVRKKLSMNAKKGKSGCVTTLFIIALLLALLNDSLDIIATLAAWIIGLLAGGVGIAATAPAIEVILDVVDVITTALLVLFSFYVGGKTKAGATKKIKPLLRCVGGAAIEMIPVVNLFATWVVVVLMNWHEARKRASKAEKIEADINQLRG